MRFPITRLLKSLVVLLAFPSVALAQTSLPSVNWGATGVSPFPPGSRSPSHFFWNGPGVDQVRFPGRAFFGAGVADTGFNSFPQSDWLSQLTQAGQPAVPFGTGDFATVYVLSSPSTVAGTPSNIATPTQALMAGGSSLYGISTGPTTFSTPRTIECSMVNNVIAAPTGGGPKVPTWCHYAVNARTSANSGQSYVAEFDIANFVAAVTGWTPESQTGVGSIGLEIASGAGLSPAGQFPTTAGMYFAANPTQFGAGMLFLINSIGAYGPVASPIPSGAGPGATITGIGLEYNQEIQFYHGGLQERIFGDTSDNLNLMAGSGNININGRLTSAAGANAFLVASPGQVSGLAVNGAASFVNFNGSAFVPGTTSAVNLGSTSLRWAATYTDNLVVTQGSPLSGGACLGGQIVGDTNYLYVCAATGAWKRVAMTGGY